MGIPFAEHARSRVDAGAALCGLLRCKRPALGCKVRVSSRSRFAIQFQEMTGDPCLERSETFSAGGPGVGSPHVDIRELQKNLGARLKKEHGVGSE